jgi:hypothetical protein
MIVQFFVSTLSRWIVNGARLLAIFSRLVRIIIVHISTLFIGAEEHLVLTASDMIGF